MFGGSDLQRPGTDYLSSWRHIWEEQNRWEAARLSQYVPPSSDVDKPSSSLPSHFSTTRADPSITMDASLSRTPSRTMQAVSSSSRPPSASIPSRRMPSSSSFQYDPITPTNAPKPRPNAPGAPSLLSHHSDNRAYTSVYSGEESRGSSFRYSPGPSREGSPGPNITPLHEHPRTDDTLQMYPGDSTSSTSQYSSLSPYSSYSGDGELSKTSLLEEKLNRIILDHKREVLAAAEAETQRLTESLDRAHRSLIRQELEAKEREAARIQRQKEESALAQLGPEGPVSIIVDRRGMGRFRHVDACGTSGNDSSLRSPHITRSLIEAHPIAAPLLPPVPSTPRDTFAIRSTPIDYTSSLPPSSSSSSSPSVSSTHYSLVPYNATSASSSAFPYSTHPLRVARERLSQIDRFRRDNLRVVLLETLTSSRIGAIPADTNDVIIAPRTNQLFPSSSRFSTSTSSFSPSSPSYSTSSASTSSSSSSSYSRPSASQVYHFPSQRSSSSFVTHPSHSTSSLNPSLPTSSSSSALLSSSALSPVEPSSRRHRGIDASHSTSSIHGSTPSLKSISLHHPQSGSISSANTSHSSNSGSISISSSSSLSSNLVNQGHMTNTDNGASPPRSPQPPHSYSSSFDYPYVTSPAPLTSISSTRLAIANAFASRAFVQAGSKAPLSSVVAGMYKPKVTNTNP